MAKETQKEKRNPTGLRWHIARQVISAATIFALIYGMHCSENPNLRNCADSIGRALRHDADITGIATRIKDAFVPASPAENPPEGITFQ